MKKMIKYLGTMSVLFAMILGTTLLVAARNTPTRGSSVSSWSDFVVSSPFSQNKVIDRPRVWVPVAGGAELSVSSLVGLGTGTPALSEINNSEIAGFTLDANNEAVAALVPVPSDIDVAKDIRIRVLWSNSESAGTGAATFTCEYTPLTIGTDAIAVGGTALDTAITADVDLAANVLNWSPWGVIAGGTLADTPGDDVIVVRCKVTLDTIANATVYAFQMDYYREYIGGDASY
jgi:hypothetical protein